MKLFYYYDSVVHKEKNSSGCDYTPAYIPAILDNLGYTAEKITPNKLDNLTGNDVIIIGAELLSDEISSLICKKVKCGLTVIAFGTKGKGLFPETELVTKGDDIYQIVGYTGLKNKDELLPILHSFESILDNCKVLGSAKQLNNDTEYPVYGRWLDRIWYWSFDLVATMLRTADGKPVEKPKKDAMLPFGRIPDSYVVGKDHNYNVAYNDVYQQTIIDVLTEKGIPRVWQLPVNNNESCDMALYFAGDDDAHSAENDIMAAEEMQKRGLPYHINLMTANTEGDFVITKDQYKYLQSIGCELALHYDFLKFDYSKEGYKTQTEMYKKAFGETGGGPVNHCLICEGEAGERYCIQRECGVISDNNRFQTKPDENDINAFNLCGYAFGSAFPRFVISNAKNGNAKMDFCEIYNSYYEPRIYNCLPEEYDKVKDYLDSGYYYGRTLQLFTHPHYISGATDYCKDYALRAIDYALNYVKENGWKVWYCGPDALALWWHNRVKCNINEITKTGFIVSNNSGYEVAVELGENVGSVTVNGNAAQTIKKRVAGKNVVLVKIGQGISNVSYKYV